MTQYRSEILWAGTKLWSDKADEKDIAALDELLNRRAQEGWELAEYNYMATSTQIKGAFLVTFKREI